MDNRLLPVIVAHRGYASKYPENTIAAFDAAAKVGARWVEVDVQMRNGVPVLSHDPELTGDEPTLEDFASWLADHPRVSAFIDFKSESLREFGRKEVVLPCMAILDGLPWVPVSFDYEALSLAVAHGCESAGWVVTKFNDRIARRAMELPAGWLFINQIFLPPGPVPIGPWEWVVYEVENIEQADSLLARGFIWLETMAVGDLI